MKKLLISNCCLILLVLSFYQFNASMMNFIYFNPTQSFFTRSDFLFYFVVGLVVFLGLSFIALKLFEKMETDLYKQIFFIEIQLLNLIAIASSIRYIYMVFNPTNPNIMIFAYIEVYKVLVIWYFLELLFFSTIGIISFKRFFSRRA